MTEQSPRVVTVVGKSRRSATPFDRVIFDPAIFDSDRSGQQGATAATLVAVPGTVESND